MSAHSIIAFFSHIPTDWIILAAFVAIAAFDALRGGLGRITAFSLALPLAALASQWVPNTAIVGGIAKGLSTAAMQAALFAALGILFFVVIYRIVRTYSGSERPMQAIIGGIAAAVVLAVTWLRVPALIDLWHPGVQATTLFGSSYGLLWLIGALVALSFTRA